MQARFLKSKRVLLIGIVLLTAGVSIAILATRAEPHRVAVENLERMGAEVNYDHHYYNVNLFGQSQTLWETTGPGVAVLFGDKPAPRREEFPLLWRSLNELGAIYELSLSGLPLHDRDLKELESHTNLAFLDLSNTPITDVGLSHLKRLPSLETLNLDGTLVTDNGLRQLSQMQNLSDLFLTNTEVTKAGLAALSKRAPNLRVSTE
ncbi:MAG: hypothetical protein HON53_16035 [Planctomycetaceae bacterium]|jgi:hypothetical protein|nr:hypothetical protein [Planctomycetaceae bacterium]MBT6153560.1 hypothetical protein [Planctomycetaceae bacterium]MBT6483059.1 hypothetical protein [Planctomycetaceae bacterium]MBT6495392.1 hypothetical protein [Planctomycetaceae bacterium]